MFNQNVIKGEIAYHNGKLLELKERWKYCANKGDMRGCMIAACNMTKHRARLRELKPIAHKLGVE